MKILHPYLLLDLLDDHIWRLHLMTAVFDHLILIFQVLSLLMILMMRLL